MFDTLNSHFVNIHLLVCFIRPISSTHQLRFLVDDANNFWPKFSQSKYTFSMTSDTGFAEKIGTGVNATDEDSGKFGQIRYSLDQSSFPEPYFEVDTF